MMALQDRKNLIWVYYLKAGHYLQGPSALEKKKNYVFLHIKAHRILTAIL